MKGTPPSDIDEYIAQQPADVQPLLRAMRQTIRKAAPGAQEAISYQMPTFKFRGKNLVHFAAYARHVGFYPASEAMEVFAEQFSPYKTSKGAVQFPLSQPLPLGLVRDVVKYRVKRVEQEAAGN